MRLRATALACVCLGLAAAPLRAQPATEEPAAPPVAAQGADATPQAAAAPEATQPQTELSELRSQLDALRAQTEAQQARIDQLEANAAVAELSASSDTESEAAALMEPERFRVYGFADFGFNRAWIGDRAFLENIALEDATFVLGNLNLYFDFRPGPRWQVLTEIRFSAYPHGDEVSYAGAGQTYERVDTTVFDVASPAAGARFRWGSIVIERAYAQYSAHELLNVRVGQFLTPYGIWNVDHGTPTQISLQLPWFIAIEALPQRQIGVELFGSTFPGDWELGYNAYVSNGRTASQVDYTDNKAFGLRLRASRLAPLPLTFGVSFYHGSLDDVEKRIASFAPFDIERDVVVDGHETSLGVDISIDIDALRLRSEGIVRVTRYEPGKRPELEFAAPGSTRPDTNEYFSYLVAAYRLPFWGLEPYAYGELDHSPSVLGDEQLAVGGGLNIHFTPFAQLKAQLTRAMFFDLNETGSFSDNNLTLLYSRLAVAF